MKKCVLYLRKNPELFQADNWRRFVAFVKKMKMITLLMCYYGGTKIYHIRAIKLVIKIKFPKPYNT
ncbi:putative beta-amylase [Helianthus annuus]|uniref:Beta-amylase n=1 Tax=Helianthus annuus TaxID=4232 RepID=A0A9K3DM16_HELAN|nr:putative beta-amylase [Helianthus annuus]